VARADPVEGFDAPRRRRALVEAALESIEAGVDGEIEEAVEFALASADPLRDRFGGVYADLRSGQDPRADHSSSVTRGRA